MATVDARNSRLHDIEKMVSKVQLDLDNRDYSNFTSHIAEILAMAKTKDSTFDKEMVPDEPYSIPYISLEKTI